MKQASSTDNDPSIANMQQQQDLTLTAPPPEDDSQQEENTSQPHPDLPAMDPLPDAPAESTSEPTTTTTTKSSTTIKSKKRNRDTAQGTNASSTRPAALQTSLQQIHQTLLTSPSFSPTPGASSSLPAFQAFLQSYLLTPTTIGSSGSISNSSSTSKQSSINVPHLLRHNMLSSLATLAQKHLNDVPPYVHLNPKDAAPQLGIDGEKLTVKGGMRGYRMVRGSHGVEAGGWYYEVEVLHPPSIQDVIQSLPENVRLGEGVREGFRKGLEREKEKDNTTMMTRNEPGATEEEVNGNPEEGQSMANKKKKRRLTGGANSLLDEDGIGGEKFKTSKQETGVQQYSIGGHLRIGWSMRTGELQAPVGYDRWSYGIRDIQGSRIHDSKREDRWGGVGFQPGDVVGFAIYLLDKDDYGMNATSSSNISGSSMSGGTAMKKSQTVTAQTNHIRFFKNGAPMGDFIVSRGIKSGGEAFDNIEAGTYYPAISSYMGGTARVNFGPYFIYPPKGLPTGMKLQPMCEICPKPKAPGEILDLFKKEKCILKKVEEAITQAIHDAVFLEAEVRYETYQKHLKDHVDFVRKGRTDRGLSTSDLPEPEPMPVPVPVPVSSSLDDMEMKVETEPKMHESAAADTTTTTTENDT
eukprot:CAMPEP_0176487406 /NCGR_PEP_ID=MMETSP0200_2-20121128/6111_1 /TAXON_ID=947934 /ORGANISM="Chaetoceros sp., Strain GSL56" /LENGTH=636 /DNA_ID=CAMNT_0017884225 /DNA_START=176 /DNA_END=2083 /DNA_ORIENTATION=-